METMFTNERFHTMEYAAQNWDELSLRTDYSGRFMYGENCIGFVTGRYCYADLEDILDFIGDYETDTEWVDHLRQTVRTDSMGMGQIYYWPNLKPVYERAFESESV